MTVHQKNRPWRVVRQTSSGGDVEVCAHRWEWTADVCAIRRSNREPETGVFYASRPRERVS